MLKIVNYLWGYYEMTCPRCKQKFYLEKHRYREGTICCSVNCMLELNE